MDTRATGETSTEEHPARHEDRSTWIFTAYVISGIVFFGVLAYFASTYFAK
mgnify:CR=1 FL=1